MKSSSRSSIFHHQQHQQQNQNQQNHHPPSAPTLSNTTITINRTAEEQPGSGVRGTGTGAGSVIELHSGKMPTATATATTNPPGTEATTITSSQKVPSFRYLSVFHLYIYTYKCMYVCIKYLI